MTRKASSLSRGISDCRCHQASIPTRKRRSTWEPAPAHCLRTSPRAVRQLALKSSSALASNPRVWPSNGVSHMLWIPTTSYLGGTWPPCLSICPCIRPPPPWSFWASCPRQQHSTFRMCSRRLVVRALCACRPHVVRTLCACRPRVVRIVRMSSARPLVTVASTHEYSHACRVVLIVVRALHVIGCPILTTQPGPSGARTRSKIGIRKTGKLITAPHLGIPTLYIR